MLTRKIDISDSKSHNDNNVTERKLALINKFTNLF